MFSNPAAGYITPSQFTAPSGIYIQMDSLDDKGNRILSQEQGYQYLESNPFMITFKYDYPEDFFYRNQTICMSFDGNEEDLNGNVWEINGCDTIYDINENIRSESTLVCECSKVSNFYMAIITDRSREMEIVPLFME